MPGNALYKNIEFQQSLLDSISKNILDFLAVTRKDNRKIVFVNKAGAEMFEYKNADSLLNTLVLSLWKDIPDEKKLIRMDKQIESKGFYSEEIECKTKKSSLFWGFMRCSSFSVGGEEFHLLQIEKIDRARAAEESLLKAKQRFGALMDYASLGVVIINSERQIVLINSFALQLFGYQRKELKGENIEILIPQRFHKVYTLHHDRFYKDPKTGPIGEGMTLFARKKDGTEFPVEISLGHYTIKKETFVITFVSDVSARKKTEEQIIKLNTELEKKVNERTNELAATIKKIKDQIAITELAKAELLRISEFQKAVLDYSGALIIATDPNGIITLFNTAAEEVLGYKAEEVIGKFSPSLWHDETETVQRAKRLSQELKKEISPGFEAYVAKSKAHLLNTDEWTYVKKSGERFPVTLTVNALRNEKDEITGFLGVAVDITEIKKTEKELKKALVVEKELSQLKSRFVSIASHEFRTPLSGILSSIYLLQKYTHPEDQLKREKHIERIVSSVNILTDILNDFLNVGKIEEGRIAPQFNFFNLEDHINGVLDEVKEIQKRGQQILYRHEGENNVLLDPSLLRHIISNLLSNAIKFSPEESPIHLSTHVKPPVVEIRINDRGIGIPKQDQFHLFERFFRASNVTAIQGTGLGLHIVHKYVELMNGKVVCKSERDKGTEFIITFKTKVHSIVSS